MFSPTPAFAQSLPSVTSPESHKVDESPEVSAAASPYELGRTEQLILNNQQTILSASKLVEHLASYLGETLPDNFQPPACLDDLRDGEKYEELLKTVKALDLYFRDSAITRKGIRERWESTNEESKIDQLSQQAKTNIISALKESNLANPVPPRTTQPVPFLYPGAAIPRMNLRPQSQVLAEASSNSKPSVQMCLGTPRELDKTKDFLEDSSKNQELMGRIDKLVCDLADHLGTKKTEAHAYMALVDMLRESQPESMLTQQPVYLCHTGELSYFEQSLQDSGDYKLEEMPKAGRPNTEATFKSALGALKQLNMTMPEELVLVINQPHITAQQLAAERVAALPDYSDQPPISIMPCGDGASLDGAATHSIFLAIDSVRKTIQLLNPSYHVTTNWDQAPECKLFKSDHPGEWELVKPEPVPSPERLI